MNKQRWMHLALFALLATACVAGFAAAQDAATPDDPGAGSTDQPAARLPELEGEAAPAKPFTIAQQLGLGAGNEEAGSVEATASFSLQEGTRRGVLSLTANISPEWHIYSLTQPKGATMPSKIKVAESADFKVLGPFQPDQAPHIKHDKLYRVPLEEHDGVVTWTAPIELAEGVKPEGLKIPLTLSGQICKTACMLYKADATAEFAGFTAAPATPGEYRPDPREAEVVFRGHIEPAAVRPGGTAKLVITAEPTAGNHIYPYSRLDAGQTIAKPTLIALSPLPGWTRSPVTASAEPTVVPSEDPKSTDEIYHDKPVTWTINLTAPANSAEGEYVVSGYLGFQTCKNGGGCLRPTGAKFRASLPVAAAEQTGTIPLEFLSLKAAAGSSPAGEKAIKGYADVARLAAANPGPTGEIDYGALGMYVGFGLLGGLILNLMPCVLPVIGLKVLSFVQQGGQSRGRVFALNLWFAAGLLLVFLALATAAAFANLGWGQQFTYTWFKVAMVMVVFAFALSFLGVWEVPIPGFAQSNSSSKLQKQEGATGAFFKGIFTTLLATPCSGPFLGPVFGFTLTQPPIVTYIVFASVGVGMASPYILIGAFPALVKWLPKPGAWMETFKQIMGFVLLGTVVYLFSTINSDYFIPTLALMMGVWLACWWIGKVPIYEATSKQAWAWIGGCAAAALIGYASFTFLGPVKHLYEWGAYAPEKIATLQAEGHTVMVDFTADWCLTCQWNFKRAINTQRVKSVVEENKITPMLADWTDENETIRQRLAELNSKSIPLLAIYPAGKPGEVIVLQDVISEQQLLTALKQAGPSKSAAPAAAGKSETAMTP